ncbi:hypothetical protein [Dyadobacter arcticus]|uniref:Secreted protein n=1 Tax=Dyadobacter arcticus TaxID=1078754 RepID=A0ABX0UFZ2_9BACT|nr:hypothetical protein [Dyadobacter arcticus]NIJ51917.1 hypothetical protein [Dyadobacter arcticus]
MRRGTRVLLGFSVALITAASLHLTVGDRFHKRMHGNYAGFGCGQHWRSHYNEGNRRQAEPLESPAENLNSNQ